MALGAALGRAAAPTTRAGGLPPGAGGGPAPARRPGRGPDGRAGTCRRSELERALRPAPLPGRGRALHRSRARGPRARCARAGDGADGRCPSSRPATCACTTPCAGLREAPVVVLSTPSERTSRCGTRRCAALEARSACCATTPAATAGPVTPGPYTIEQLGGDVLAPARRARLERAHFCGLSIGRPDRDVAGRARARPHRASWCCATRPRASARPRAGTRASRRVRQGGMGAVAPAVVERWFTRRVPRALAGGRRRGPRACSRRRRPRATSAACAALRDADLARRPRGHPAPTLVVAGSARPGHAARRRPAPRRRHPGARYVELDAAHLSNLEAPDGVHRRARALPGRQRRKLMDERKRYRRGMSVRRAVLGDAHVERALARDAARPRVPGPDHALRVGRDLDPARAFASHAQPAHAGAHGRAGPQRRAAPARAGSAPQRRDARRDQGGPAAHRRLLRRARRPRRLPLAAEVLAEKATRRPRRRKPKAAVKRAR